MKTKVAVKETYSLTFDIFDMNSKVDSKYFRHQPISSKGKFIAKELYLLVLNST